MGWNLVAVAGVRLGVGHWLQLNTSIKLRLESFFFFVTDSAAVRNVTQLKENKLAAVLGTCEICQLFKSAAKDVTIVFKIAFHKDPKMGLTICTFCILKVIMKNQKIQHL
jgi:hypothetical protein